MLSATRWGRRCSRLPWAVVPSLLFAGCGLPYPMVAPVRAFQERLFGLEISDPYRWMENQRDPIFQRWLRSQERYSRAVLQRISGRKAWRKEIIAVRTVAAVEYPTLRTDRLFYLKRRPGDEMAALYVRALGSEKERILVNSARSGSKSPSAVQIYSPSWDGKFVAYTTETGGSEQRTIRVVEVESGRTLPDAIDRCRFAFSIVWHPNNRSFFYLRLNKPVAGAPRTDLLKRPRIYHHLLGTDPEKDRAIFGHGLHREITIGGIDTHQPYYSPASPESLFVISSYSVRNEVSVFVRPLASLSGKHPGWRRLVGVKDGVTGFDVRGNDLYLLTNRGAPRGRLLRTDLRRPDLATAVTVVPESDGVLQNFTVARDALYVKDLRGGLSRIWRAPLNGGRPEALTLPFGGAAALGGGDPRVAGAIVTIEGWARPVRLYRFDGRSGGWKDLTTARPAPIDPSRFEVNETTVASNNGVRVPLSLVHRKGLRRDGSNPTLLVGYGAYGTVVEPSYDDLFTPRHMAWVRRGGVLAVAHPRGGGAHGAQWHKAGQKETKLNTIRDMIACAEHLIRVGITRPAKLALHGMSAGGLMVARTLTERPDLFAIAVVRMGVANPLRFEITPLGSYNISEFGTVKVERELRALHAMDGTHHVRPGVAYPAVLFTAGRNDPRVPIWQMAKMAARLQRHSTSGKPVLLRVYDAQGHGMGAAQSRTDEEMTDTFAFLLDQMGESGTVSTGMK